MRTDTAHAVWNARWSDEAGRADWLIPDPEVVSIAQELRGKGARRALDLGCGIGRHALLFARTGFDVTAIDLAGEGVAELRRRAASEGLAVTAGQAPMTVLPYDDGAFDYVLSFNVIYHGDEAIVLRTFSEVRRVLARGGTFQGTMLSKRNAGYGIGAEVAPNTFTREPNSDDPDESDKGHPHFYCNAAELIALLDGFEVKSLRDIEQKKPGAWHWHVVAEKL